MVELTLETQVSLIDEKIQELKTNIETYYPQKIQEANDNFNEWLKDPKSQYTDAGLYYSSQQEVWANKLKEAKQQLAEFEKTKEIFIRDIDVRNRQLETQSNMFNNSTLNSLKNINNEVIAQSMQNEDLKNNIIKGGVIVGSLALLSGIILKKKRSRK